MYVSTPFRRLAQKSRSALVVGALTLCGAFAAPSLAQTQVTNTANITLPTGVVDTDTSNNISTVNVAVVHDMGNNIEPVLRDVMAGTSPYHFIEVMNCAGGCVNGGGQPIEGKGSSWLGNI